MPTTRSEAARGSRWLVLAPARRRRSRNEAPSPVDHASCAKCGGRPSPPRRQDRQPSALAAFSVERTKSLESGGTHASQRRPPAEDRQTALADFTEGHDDWSSDWEWPDPE